MANELKFGNKVIFLNGNPILLPVGTSDPGSASAGDLFFRTDTGRVRYYNGTIWQNLAFGDVITSHSALSGLSADDHTQYLLLAGRAGGQIAVGGTANSNNLILRSTSAGTKGQVWIDETTASSSATTGALRVDGGIGVGGSVYAGASLSAATSVITPAIDRASAGTLAVGGSNTTQLDLGVNAVTTTGNLFTGGGNNTINLGTGSGTNTINIGGANSTVNIIGTLEYVQTTNLQVSDKLITINKGGAAASGDGSGLEIEENSSITGYLKVGNSRASWDFKAPVAGANARVARITPPGQNFIGELAFATLTANRTYTFPDNTGTVALTSDLSSYLPLAGGSMTGAITMTNQNQVRFGDTGSNYTAIQGAATIGSNYIITLPASAPGANTSLFYDGSNYVWASGSSGTVNSGVAGRLPVYAATGSTLSDLYVQNGQNMELKYTASPTRSSPITYSIPNPGDAVSAASFVLTEGAQTLNGAKTFSSDILWSANNARSLGSDAAEASVLWAYALQHNDASTPALNIKTTGNNGSVIITAHGTGNLDVLATKIRRTENGAGSNYFEDQYFDNLALAANTASATEISSSLSFAVASFVGAVLNYTIIEATSGKTRIGQFIVSSDGTIASSSDQFSETAALGSALGLQLDADVNSGNVRIRFNNTHATNACSMRVQIRRFRA